MAVLYHKRVLKALDGVSTFVFCTVPHKQARGITSIQCMAHGL